MESDPTLAAAACRQRLDRAWAAFPAEVAAAVALAAEQARALAAMPLLADDEPAS